MRTTVSPGKLFKHISSPVKQEMPMSLPSPNKFKYKIPKPSKKLDHKQEKHNDSKQEIILECEKY